MIHPDPQQGWLPVAGERHPARADGVVPATPLWQRVPTRDADGRPLGDFMLLLPGLREAPRAEQGRLLGRLDAVLRSQREHVVFAECNLRLNLLWVSVRPGPGLCLEVAARLLEAVPQARLVASRLAT
ncbi:MAG TPA: hypothetical protein VIX81_00970 [Gammaproteobacteria bacterium]